MKAGVLVLLTVSKQYYHDNREPQGFIIWLEQDLLRLWNLTLKLTPSTTKPCPLNSHLHLF